MPCNPIASFKPRAYVTTASSIRRFRVAANPSRRVDAELASGFSQIDRAPSQECGGLLGAHGAAEVKALGLGGAIALFEHRVLLLGFDTLGDDCDANVVGEAHDRAHGGGVLGVDGGLADVGAGDLQVINAVFLNVVERRVLAAETVDSEPDAEGAQLREDIVLAPLKLGEGGLCDVDFEVARGESPFVERLLDVADEGGAGLELVE